MAAESTAGRWRTATAGVLCAFALGPLGVKAQTATSSTAAATAAAPASTSSSATAAASQPWPEVGRQGVVRLVVVPLEQMRDRAAYERQIALLCPSDGRCFINFYSNSTGAALSTPLPDAVFQEPTVVFRRSDKRSAEQFRWACRLGLEPGNCF